MVNKIKQIRFPNNEKIDEWEEGWSKTNLAPGLVKQLGIYALPGSTFKIGQNGNAFLETFVINGSGIFSIDVEDRPIKDLRISKSTYENTTEHQPIIIDFVYEEVLVNE